MAKVKFSRGSQRSYEAIQLKDDNTIYVCTDTGNIYLGGKLLFEPGAYIGSSISGKTVTFRTHGANGTGGSVTLDLSVFQTAAEVQSAINAAISSVYKPQGNINFYAGGGMIDSYLIEDCVGWVFNLDTDYTVTDQSVGYFIDAQVGQKIKAGTNLVIVEHSQGGTITYKWDLLGGFMDLSNYVEKVSNPTAGNFAGLDANGNITDSGYKPSDFKTKQTAVTPSAGTTNGAAGGQYVEQVTQNANGEVTVTRKKLPDFTGSGRVGEASSAADAWKTVVHDVSLSS
ncbi:MAG: hypothetical protein IJL44_07440, partial [Bacteroidales bacterium]|nr:hypothetical protein [Bacteroidales bacterium]